MKLYSFIRAAWKLEMLRPDIAFARDEASHFLPWIIALMVYLAALTLTGGLTMHLSITAQHAAQVESFSVHLPHSDNIKEASAKALSIIQRTSGVQDASILTLTRIRQIVEPWFGKGEALESLPLPVIINARLEANASIDYDALKAKIQAVAPGAEIDDHKAWLAQFSQVVRCLQWVLFAIALLIIATSAAVVVFACKTSLKIHRGTVNLLHRLGALDSYIAGQFQYHAALLALKGAFIGSGFAAGTLAILHLMAQHIDSPLFPSFALTGQHWIILLGLPLFMSLVALASAHSSVLTAVRKMP